MDAKTIFTKRKELDEKLIEVVNIYTGEYTKEKSEYDLAIKELQKECPHEWDNGEPAIVKNNGRNICSICKKKWTD